MPAGAAGAAGAAVHRVCAERAPLGCEYTLRFQTRAGSRIRRRTSPFPCRFVCTMHQAPAPPVHCRH